MSSTTLRSRCCYCSHYTDKETSLGRGPKLSSSEGWEALEVGIQEQEPESILFALQHSARPAGAHCSPSARGWDSSTTLSLPNQLPWFPWASSTRPLYTTQAPSLFCPPVSLHTGFSTYLMSLLCSEALYGSPLPKNGKSLNLA